MDLGYLRIVHEAQSGTIGENKSISVIMMEFLLNGDDAIGLLKEHSINETKQTEKLES